MGDMADEARLVLTKVRIGRTPGSLYVFDDRLELDTDDGARTIPITQVERVTNRRSWRGSRLILALSDGRFIEVRGLSPSHSTRAHRTILTIARAAR